MDKNVLEMLSQTDKGRLRYGSSRQSKYIEVPPKKTHGVTYFTFVKCKILLGWKIIYFSRPGCV